MGFLGRLFGTEKAIDNILDKDNGLLSKAGSWVGGLSYTKEEKAEAQERTREWGLKQLEALAPFKVVQRILAFAVCSLWIFVAINVVVCIYLESYNPSLTVKADMMAFAMSDYVFWPVMAVFALYFAGGVIPTRKAK